MQTEPAKIILLVEDNPGDVGLTRLALEAHGVSKDLVVASNGQEALDFILCTGNHKNRDSRALPALILLDLKLPRMDGLEFLRHLRADSRMATIPVVVLTSSDRDADVADSYQLGCNSYIQKPTTFSGLLDVMGQVVSYWLRLNQTLPMAA